jgi:hypothetical protein
MKQLKNISVFCLVVGTDIEKKNRLCLRNYKNERLMVNFKFAKYHCYQQIQSFLVTGYIWPLLVFKMFGLPFGPLLGETKKV